jgi:hypothetical protein
MAKEKINIVLQGINQFDKTFKDVKRGLDTIDRKTKLIQKGLGLAAKTTAASFTAVGIAVGVSTARIDKLVKTSEKLGVGTEFLQKFRFAAEQVGIRSETADMALQRFSRRVAEARRGTGEAKDTLTQLGIALFDSAGKARDIEDVMLDVSDAMANTEDASELVRQSFKFFDSEGVALVALMKNGSEAMQEFFTDAENLGAVLSTDAAKGVADFADEFTRVKTAIRGVMDQFTAGLAPVLEKISEDFAQFIIDTNAEIEKLGFDSLGQYLATEFLDIIYTVTNVLEGTFNTIIGLLNAVTERGISLGLIEESENAKALRAELDSLGTMVNDQLSKGSAFGTLKKVFTEEELKRRQEILGLLEKENLITELNLSETRAYIKEIQELLKEGIETDDGTTLTTGGTEEVSRFLRTADQAFTNFKKETIEGMMVKGFENAFKSAEDALLNFVQTGKLNFKDLVQSILADLARIRIREFLTGGDEKGDGFNLFGKVGDFLSSFDNGGFTGIGNRTGGIDGKGGFPAILHPNETVIDHHRGQQVGQQPVNVNFSIQATDATGIDELLASRKNQIVAMINQAMNQKGKVGLI